MKGKEGKGKVRVRAYEELFGRGIEEFPHLMKDIGRIVFEGKLILSTKKKILRNEKKIIRVDNGEMGAYCVREYSALASRSKSVSSNFALEVF